MMVIDAWMSDPAAAEVIEPKLAAPIAATATAPPMTLATVRRVFDPVFCGAPSPASTDVSVITVTLLRADVVVLFRTAYPG
ncbi:hypothetical protein K8P10_000625 [Leucobacter sp. Psy1]|nr:hypothetical protein K8P10_000625 [Leucobacter sp. Psy1]